MKETSNHFVQKSTRAQLWLCEYRIYIKKTRINKTVVTIQKYQMCKAKFATAEQSARSNWRCHVANHYATLLVTYKKKTTRRILWRRISILREGPGGVETWKAFRSAVLTKSYKLLAIRCHYRCHFMKAFIATPLSPNIIISRMEL